MAEEKADKPKRADVSVRMDGAVARRARIAAAAAGMTLTEWLSARVAVVADEEVAAINADSPSKKSKKS